IISTGKEAKQLHFIAPILILVCCKLDNVEILVEEDMDGKNVHINGKFEFMLKQRRTTLSAGYDAGFAGLRSSYGYRAPGLCLQHCYELQRIDILAKSQQPN
ncbi:437_t:CDS:1, partial [Ambispora leptoticha]